MSKSITQYTRDGTYVDSFVSAKEAGDKTGFRVASICCAANGQMPTYKNFRWKYKS